MPATPDPADAQRAAVDNALSQLDLETKCRLLAGQDTWTLPGVERIGLESIVMSDGPIGVRGRQWTGDPAIALPSPTAQAAAWDPSLAAASGLLLAAEARRKGVHVLLAPTINLHRSPRGGRHFEAYSEDPLLTGRMAAGFVRGVQSGGIATTVKHFVGNEAETDRMTVDNRIDERTLRELYLPPFAEVLAAGGWGVMSAYNSVNGTTMTANAALQRDVLRDEWGFDGFIVSDWTASRDTVGSITGGTDVAMPGPRTVYGEALARAVTEGAIDESVVDESVRRLLRLAARVGALSGAPASVPAPPAAPDGAAHAREVARRSFVLLSNRDRALPVPPDTRIAVIGLPAAQPRIMGGGSAQVFPYPATSPLEALRSTMRPGDFDYVPALDPRTKLPPVREGFTLRVVARDLAGDVLHEAELPDGAVSWIGDLPSGVDFDRLDTVEITGEFVPDQLGTHQFAAAGVGDFTLTVDGTALYQGAIPPEGDDPVAGFLSPPERRAVVDLAAGVPVEIGLVHRVHRSARSPFPVVAFRLGHCGPLPDPDEGIAQARRSAEAADAAIVFVTTTEAVESEGFDRPSLALPGRQDDLVAAVAAANPRTIVVVTAGAPVEMPWAGDVAAVLLTWFGGQEFGPALSDVLTGVAEPGGRLPTTWPARLADAPVSAVEPDDGVLRYDEGRFIGYRAWQRHDIAPAWWFGHGLGYTDWEYGEPEFTPSEVPGQWGSLTVTARNIGDRDGRDVAQVYVEPADPDDDRPLRWLAGFAPVTAPAGGSTTVTVDIPDRAVQSWDTDAHNWLTRPGQYRLVLGRSVADIRAGTDVEVP